MNLTNTYIIVKIHEIRLFNTPICPFPDTYTSQNSFALSPLLRNLHIHLFYCQQKVIITFLNVMTKIKIFNPYKKYYQVLSKVTILES